MKDILLASAAVLFLSGPVAAQDNDNRMSDMGRGALDAAKSMFTEGEEQTIKDFYQKRAEEILRGRQNRSEEDDPHALRHVHIEYRQHLGFYCSGRG